MAGYVLGPYVPTNIPPGLSNVTAIAAGYTHCLALKSNGTVVAWGGRTGFRPPLPSPSPTNVPAGLSNVIAIAAGDSHSLALKADGQVVGWGATKAATVPVGLSNVIAIAAGGNQSLALKSDGHVISWGISTNVPSTLSNVIAIACADGYSLALQTSDKVVAWATPPLPGWPVPPPVGPVNTNVPLDLSNVVAIAAGGYGMALKSDGSVVTWGSYTNSPPTGLSNVFAIAAGESLLAALVGNGSPHFTIQPVSQTVTKGATVQFHARGVGVQPMSCQWQLDGENLVGATNADLTITNAQGKDTGGYRAVVADALGAATSATAQLTIPFSTNLAAALNATNLVWTTSPTDAPWFAQIRETHDGDAAAQSGDIGHSRQSVLQTTVTGPGMLTFWWKVSSEEGYDYLWFNVDVMSSIRAISGETDWQQVTMPIPAGPHMVRWVYSKDSTVSAGQDAGWVDQVVFIPSPPVITTQPMSQSRAMGETAVFTAAAFGAPPLSCQWLKAGTNMVGATDSTLVLSNVCRRDAGVYALRVTNPGGSTLSSNAFLTVRVPQRLCTPAWGPDGSFVFWSGDADGGSLCPGDLAGFEVQASTNLVDWMTLSNALTLTNGALRLEDPAAVNCPMRFYRLIEH